MMIWHDSYRKIKHEALRVEFQAGGLKSVDIRFKFEVFSVLGLKNYMVFIFMNGR